MGQDTGRRLLPPLLPPGGNDNLLLLIIGEPRAAGTHKDSTVQSLPAMTYI